MWNDKINRIASIMKNMNIKWTLLLAAMFSFAACDTDVEYDIPEV